VSLETSMLQLEKLPPFLTELQIESLNLVDRKTLQDGGSKKSDRRFLKQDQKTSDTQETNFFSGSMKICARTPHGNLTEAREEAGRRYAVRAY
jgi:hypothetical protein